MFLAAGASFTQASPLSTPAPALSIQAPSASGVTRVTAVGSGANFNLEGSLDLAHWYQLLFSSPVAGSAQFLHTNTEPVAAWFYRVVAAPIPAAPQPVAASDPLYTAAALVTPAAGGSIDLQDRNGVLYHFQISSNQVYEPVAVQMSVITNFTGFPDHDGFRAAVAFSPDGYDFRGQGELTITFPSAPPADLMLAYSADAGGALFRLRPSTAASNQVIIPITHFSTAGTAAFSTPKIPSADQALRSTRDARNLADDQAARLIRAARDKYVDGLITRDDFAQRVQTHLLDALDQYYLSGVAPLLGAALADCDVGSVVMRRFDQLSASWAQITGRPRSQSPYEESAIAMARRARCNCAHLWLQRCEQDPNASNENILAALSNDLIESSLITGRGDAQGCDLGSDAEIMQKFASSACARVWEGQITLTRVTTVNQTISGSSSLTGSENTTTREQFIGRIGPVASQLGGNLAGGGTWHSWSLQTEGLYSASQSSLKITETDNSTTHSLQVDTEQGADVRTVVGDNLQLRLNNGLFATAGLGGPKKSYSFPTLQTSSYKLTCKQPGSNCPAPTYTVQTGGQSVYQGYSFSRTDPEVKSITEDTRRLIVTWHQRTEYPAFPPYQGSTVEEDDILLDLYKGLAP